MEYTKGKWIQYYRSEGNVIEKKTGRTIANCMSYSSNINFEKILDENLSNAKLISKAPEMHEALKEISELLEKNYEKLQFISWKIPNKIKSLLKEIES